MTFVIVLAAYAFLAFVTMGIMAAHRDPQDDEIGAVIFFGAIWPVTWSSAVGYWIGRKFK